MIATLRVARRGRTTSLQDGGRVGVARFGVPRSGPMDRVAHRLAARLAGVPAEMVSATCALEVGPDGCVLEVGGGGTSLAVAGIGAAVSVDGVQHDAPCVAAVPDGASVQVRPGVALGRPDGMWAYVVPGGGVDVPPVLGATAQHVRSGLGPGLEQGTVLSVRPVHGAPRPGARRSSSPRDERLLLLPGPQHHLFPSRVLEQLTSATFTTTAEQDRMGQRLAGPTLSLPGGHDIVSDGVVPGALQLPGDGQLFVLTADAQTTGGYPKPAVLAATSLAQLVQLPPGTPVRFAWSDVDAARRALEAAHAAIERVVTGSVRPHPDALAAHNLVGGVTDGDASTPTGGPA